MILAAGRGQRMGELTLKIPKPLLKVRNHYLIEYAIASLKKAKIQDIIINVSYFADDIRQAVGDGQRYGVNICYSYETTALETGGGIYQALPLLGSDRFVVINSDIITDYPLQQLCQPCPSLINLLLVNNPTHHPEGDFYLDSQCHGTAYRALSLMGEHALTFSGIGVYRPELFHTCRPGKFRLAPLLTTAIQQGKATGIHYPGLWLDVGTEQRLQQAAQQLAKRPSALLDALFC